jgi:hypothetical protein
MWNPAITKKEVTLLDGTTLNQQQCFIRAIHIKPTYAAAYYELFSTIPTTTIPVVLENGDVLSKQQLLEKAVSLLPCAHYYSTLAEMLSPEQTVVLSDGTSANAQQLYILAIELEPSEIRNYQQLAALLAPDQGVKLQDGREMDRKQLALIALDLRPDGPLNYWNLASTLGDNWEETQTLLDGTVWNKEKLLLALVNIDPKDTPTLFLLGKRLAQLGPEATFTLIHGPVKTGQQFLLRYFEICTETRERLDPMVFHWLGLTVPKEDGAILLPDGVVANRARLFWETIRFQPNAFSYIALADCLEDDPSSFVQLTRGKYGKQDLLREAYLLDPTLAPPSQVKKTGKGTAARALANKRKGRGR